MADLDPSMTGILGGSNAMAQMQPWQTPVGILGSGLKDMAAYMGRRPEDATNIAQYGQFMRQQQARSALAQTPFTGDAKGYVQSLLQSGVPIDVALQAAQGQRNLQGFKTLSPQDATARGYRAGSVVQESPDGQDRVSQESDMLSQGRVAQENAQRHITPITNPNDPRLPPLSARPPGAQYGIDAAGNLTMTNTSDAKSQMAQQQDMSQRTAALEAQMRMFQGGNGNVNDLVQATVDAIHNGQADFRSIPSLIKPLVLKALSSDSNKNVYSPQAGQRFTSEASRITSPYEKLPQYQRMASSFQPIARIDEAMKNPGSVSDQELLDAITKLSTQGQVTEAQTNIITKGKSLSDWANVMKNQLTSGGVLSDQQRKDIQTISHNISGAYQKQYQPLYNEVTGKLQGANIPKPFWTIPDLASIGAQGQTATAAPAAPGASVPPPLPGQTLPQMVKPITGKTSTGIGFTFTPPAGR